MNSRTEMATKNVMWAYGNMIITTILKFVCRWAFIHTIGETFLGINGLYTSVLGVLALTELGVGTAMNYSLYKPVAENDTEKIKSLMKLYKWAYRIIAVVVAVLGLALVPFLPMLIKGAEGVEHLKLYYLLFLFNTVSSYFVSYKFSLCSADQRNYICNNINTVATIVMNILQVMALFVFRSYLVYLIIQIGCLLCSNIFAFFYLDKLYPYLKEKNVQPLASSDRKIIFANVRALVVHKLGDVAVNQTDNIIISSFINVAMTGLISNYTLITGTVESFLNVIFNNITGSLGNLCATTDKDHQYQVYKSYDFVSVWMFGFSAIAYSALIQPFTQLMWGKDYVVDFSVVMLIILNTYFVGQRIPLHNMKVATGIFIKDKYLALIQAAVNLVVSVVLVKQIGLIGVYIGTIVSGFVPIFVRPIMTFRMMFGKSPVVYFGRFISHLIVIVIIGGINYAATFFIMYNLNWLTFFIAVAVTAVLPNLLLFLVYRKSNEFRYLESLAIRLIRRKKELR